MTVTKALAGATFTLYNADPTADGFVEADHIDATTVSDENGNIAFTGLDEGTYYMKETVTPKGFALASQTYKFVISADFNDNGTMKSYTVTSSYKNPEDEKWTDAGAASYTATSSTQNDDGSVKNTITRNDDPVVIENTRIQSLPSTGGRGTIAITLIALAGMTGFCVIHKKNKKKNH